MKYLRLGSIMLSLLASTGAAAAPDCASFAQVDGLTADELRALDGLHDEERTLYVQSALSAVRYPKEKFYRFLKHLPHFKTLGPWWEGGLPQNGAVIYVALNDDYTQREVDFIDACFRREYVTLELGSPQPAADSQVQPSEVPAKALTR